MAPLESLRADAHALLDPDSERLLEQSRSRVANPLARREIVGETVAATGFVVAAAAMLALLGGDRPLEVPLALALVGAYAVASRIRFEVGPCHAVPTQLVFVPMLFALPVASVPLFVAAGNLLGEAPDYLRGRHHPRRALLPVADSWHAIGPALVLALAGAGEPALSDWPVYALALGAQLALDAATSTPREWLYFGVSPRAQLPSAGWAFLVDLLLSPIGLLAAMASTEHPLGFAAVLPLMGLLAIFARERRARLDGALALSNAYRGMTMVLADFLEGDDRYTAEHSRSVVSLALQVADRLGLTPRQRRRVEFTALLHDIGKIAIPNEIINKPGRLDAEEWALVEVHTIHGQRMLEQVGGVLGEVGALVRSSHERWDGSGYPDRLRGEAIPVESRIVACCDAFNAITTTRPYRPARSIAFAVQEIRANAGTQFDPRVAKALVSVVEGAREGAPATHETLAATAG